MFFSDILMQIFEGNKNQITAERLNDRRWWNNRTKFVENDL